MIMFIDSLTIDELAALSVATFFIFVAIIIYAMVHEYMTYLDDNFHARYSLIDFIKRERFFVLLFLGISSVTIIVAVVCLLAV